MKILAFDTTDEVNSVAIFDAGKVVDLLKIEGSSKGAELLIPTIDEIMKRNNLEFEDLSAIAVTNGPASFTSVRIGLAAAKGLVLACGKDLLTYDSLLTKAYGYRDFIGKITVCIDAKMNEFFVASFLSDGEKLTIDKESCLVKGEDLLRINLDENQLLIGSGANFLTQIAQKNGVKIILGEDKPFSADNLATMAHKDLLSGNAVSNDSSANYIRGPKIGVRKV